MNRHDYRAFLALRDTARTAPVRLSHPNRCARTPTLKPRPRGGFRRWLGVLSGGAL